MLLMLTTTDKISVITSSAASLDVVANGQDKTTSTGALASYSLRTAIAAAATTDVTAVPGSGIERNIKMINIRNKHASLANDVTVQVNQNATLFELIKLTLAAGDTLEYVEGVGWFVVTNAPTTGLITTAEPSNSQRVMHSELGGTPSTFLTISGTAYFCYLGRAVKAFTAAFCEFQVTTIGAGAQTAEIGLFSSSNAPSKTAQVLTKIVATGTVDVTTSTGVKRNTASFNQAIVAGTHLWAAVRFAMATTQPTCIGLGGGMVQGQLETTTGGGALTALSATSGAIIPVVGTTTTNPDVRLTLD